MKIRIYIYVYSDISNTYLSKFYYRIQWYVAFQSPNRYIKTLILLSLALTLKITFRYVKFITFTSYTNKCNLAHARVKVDPFKRIPF